MELDPSEAQFPSAGSEATPPPFPIFKLKHILVPVDFSECTEKALAYAVPFAKQFDAALTLLHVEEPPYSSASEMGVIVKVETSTEARQQLEDLCARLAEGVKCQILTRKGSAEREIITVAKENDSDLIILGTHGRTGLERFLLGSTVEKVVRRAGCPLLIVRPQEHDFISESLSNGQATGEIRESECEIAMPLG